MTRASGIILNTFDDLKAPCLFSISNSLEPDHNCITWLDSWPLRSVVYVCFGSIARVTCGQLLEFWYGLVNSGASLLWVIQPDMIEGVEGDEMIPMDLEEATKERGFMVDWAPQENVLVHPAVGGFFTHSGWNSILESIDVGVPMICWPYLVTTNLIVDGLVRGGGLGLI
uniref:UDP-glycosyltransferase n=1 Tax=Quercus lobata TaxID=97700 RepID=A0A7N2R7R0_QUELO